MSKHILYFDGHLFNQVLVKRVLQKDGHETICANDIEHGWQLALTHQPDMILLDMHLDSQRGGIHLTRALRQIMALRNCPIFLLTPCGDTDAEIEALAAGANGFIYKPAGIRDLQTAFRAILEQPTVIPVRQSAYAPAYVTRSLPA